MDRKYTIYAVDFDGTLCENVFPSVGRPNRALIKRLIKSRKQGDKIILWTCRVGERLREAVAWCRGYGLEFDEVNANLPEIIERWGGEGRKIYADVYIDDKAESRFKFLEKRKSGIDKGMDRRVQMKGSFKYDLKNCTNAELLHYLEEMRKDKMQGAVCDIEREMAYRFSRIDWSEVVNRMGEKGAKDCGIR